MAPAPCSRRPPRLSIPPQLGYLDWQSESRGSSERPQLIITAPMLMVKYDDDDRHNIGQDMPHKCCGAGAANCPRRQKVVILFDADNGASDVLLSRRCLLISPGPVLSVTDPDPLWTLWLTTGAVPGKTSRHRQISAQPGQIYRQGILKCRLPGQRPQH